jgi:hypothetical protein
MSPGRDSLLGVSRAEELSRLDPVPALYQSEGTLESLSIPVRRTVLIRVKDPVWSAVVAGLAQPLVDFLDSSLEGGGAPGGGL